MNVGAAQAPTTRRKVSTTARSSVTVSVWTLVSRLTGLLRVVVIGAVLGPTFFANAFLASNSVPNLTYTAIAGPVLALVLVPALVKAVAERGLAESRLLMGRVNGYLLTVAALAATAIALASPLVALAVTAGIPDEQIRDQAWRLTVLMVLFVAPQLLGYTVAGIGVAVQQARGRFALAAAAPALESVGLIVTMAIVALSFEAGVDVLEVPVAMVLVLGAGSTLSVAVHAGVQMFGAWRVGLPITVRRGWRSDPHAREVTRRLRRSVVVAAFPTASMFGLIALAATVPGGVFVFQAALSVYFVIAALGAKAVTAAALPGLSASAENVDGGRFGAAWRQALSLTVTASLPAVVLLLAFAEPAAAVLANGELRDAPVVGWLAACLGVLAVAQFAHSMHEIGRQALFARLDVRGPQIVSTVNMVARLMIGFASLLLPAGALRLVALCGAMLVGEAISAALTLGMVRKAIRPERLLDRVRLRWIVLATAAMLPAAGVGWWLVRERVTERLPQVAVAIGLGSLAALCFGLVLVLLTGRFPALVGKLRARLPGGS